MFCLQVVNFSNIIFDIKDTKLYVPVVNFNKRKSKTINSFQKTWNEYKTKSESKNTTNNCRYFLQSKFEVVNLLFVLFISTKVK